MHGDGSGGEASRARGPRHSTHQGQIVAFWADHGIRGRERRRGRPRKELTRVGRRDGGFRRGSVKSLQVGVASMAGRETSKAMAGQIGASMLLPTRPGPGARLPYGTRSRQDGSTSSSPPRTVRSLHAVLVATHPFLDHQAQVREIHLKEKSKEEWRRHLSVPCGLSMHHSLAVFSQVEACSCSACAAGLWHGLYPWRPSPLRNCSFYSSAFHHA